MLLFLVLNGWQVWARGLGADGIEADDKAAFVSRKQTKSARGIEKVTEGKEGSAGEVGSGVVVVPYVLSSVARCRVMRVGGMILIILSPTVQLVTKLKPNLLG